MRRILFTVLASAALVVAVPTVALARNGHHHARHHHSRVRHLTFKAHRNDVSGSPTTSGSSGTTSGSTSEPTAGTVTSFTNNVLTITLSNGNTVSGDVTNDTELKCENPAMQGGHDNDADDNASGEQGDAVFDHGPGGGDNTGNTGNTGHRQRR